MDKKGIITVLLTLIIVITGAVAINAFDKEDYTFTRDYQYNISPESNYFTQVESFEVVSPSALKDDYVKVAETDELNLYLIEDYLSIALEVKETGYIWYSEYQDLDKYEYTEGLENYVKSGVTIEYYNATSLYESRSSILDEDTVLTYKYRNNGFTVNIDFEDLGIAFDLVVGITDDDLDIEILSDTITETEIILKSKKYPINNKLKNIEVFPFFGAENYEIDGYSFIPDGSGALIRYEEIPNTTAFRARVYGDDQGYKNDTVLYDHLQEQDKINLPVYGVVHGVNQNAFFTEVKSGDTKSELNSYPYQYLTDFNTTFMKYIYREKYTVILSNDDEGGIAIIDSDPSNTNVVTSYHFLSGMDANYVGMAQYYKEELNLTSETEKGDIPMRLEFIGLEYKKGLFGKKYQVMTSYNDIVTILEDLKESNITNNTVVYESYNKNGFYDNSPVSPKTSYKLGGSSDFEVMVNYFDETTNSLELYNDSYVSFDSNFNGDLANQITLKLFEINSESNLFEYEYYRKPTVLADPFIDNLKGYEKLNVFNIAVDTVGATVFSYRENQEYISRETAKAQVIEEMNEVDSEFNVSFYEPNSYLLNITNNYYDIAYESSRYPFMTDSVPFIQILLSGHIEMYTEYANFISDYYLYALRCIEYSINPSFILTSEPTYLLRYTNSEHIYTSEYALWEEHIKEIYTVVNSALKHVHGEEITGFEYISEGVSKTSYANSVEIVVNYSEEPVTYNGHSVESMSFAVLNGGELLE